MNKRFAQLCLVVVVLLSSQASLPGAQSNEGVYTRTLEIVVQPSDVPAWEAAMASLAKAARRMEIEEKSDWLVYRSGTAKYWIVVNRGTLLKAVTPERFVSAFAGVGQEPSFKTAIASLQTTHFVVTMDTLWQHLYEWSTVKSMSTATHPLAVVTEYSVRPADVDRFDAAMREYVSFLKRIEYPYPVEGFEWRLGRPGRYWSVTFPDTWVSYYGDGALERFSDQKNVGNELVRLRKRLSSTTQSVSETYLTFAPELSN